MFKKALALLLAAVTLLSLAACGGTSSPAEERTQTQTADIAETAEMEESADAPVSQEADLSEQDSATAVANAAANTLAEDEDALIATYADLFQQLTYTDADTNLSITYDLYLPENYDGSSPCPMVVFIGDSSCVGSATYSLTQGLGALVWATEEWQSVYPTIVAVPTYPVTILDDHDGYTTTEYVELTKRFIDYMCSEYAIDRVYGTGQSMGCMTTLILASEYPELYDACMFVDGQWDVSTLSGLEGQTFVYFAAEDDTSAWNGAQEVMAMFDEDSVSYQYAQWDGTWSADQLSEAAENLFSENENHYFISWLTGTIESNSRSSMGGTGGQSGSDGFSRPGTGMNGGGHGGSSGAGGGANSVSYHMASFDYAYNCVAVMEWLIQQ